MPTRNSFSRRDFIRTTAAASLYAFSGASVITLATPAAKYRRYNVMSPGGQKNLASYAKGVEAMMKLPPSDPRNWFRNAFVHLMDCPHGNWWFYVWHRGYVGYFEQTIRNLSGDPSFALPYWDWTVNPEMPDALFEGVLNPSNQPFKEYIKDLTAFTSYIKSPLQDYWNSLNSNQLAQLKIRGYDNFDQMWEDMLGKGELGNQAYATPDRARYLRRDCRGLDAKTAYNVSPFVIDAGLLPIDFYNPKGNYSFTSSKTPSHNTAPGKNTVFSVLEGLPHNKLHNCVAGVGAGFEPGPYGYMANFLSPTDPSFMLHHANIDRLWDVWERKMRAYGLPYLPVGTDLQVWSEDPFLFFVEGDGNYVTSAKAGDFVDMARFEYDYEPGYGEDIVTPPVGTSPVVTTSEGELTAAGVTVTVAKAAIARHLASTTSSVLVAQVTVPRPSKTSPAREFDVVIGAPAGITEVSANSPYYAGTVSFFGVMAEMKGMERSGTSTFTVPIPKRPELFKGFETAPSTRLNIRVLPSQKGVAKDVKITGASLTIRQ
jgi:tyrosinase